MHNPPGFYDDEYPYPSGVAGGEVTEGNPHFQGTRLADAFTICPAAQSDNL